MIDTNVTGTLYLIQKVGKEMRARRRGRILITGSIAGLRSLFLQSRRAPPKRCRQIFRTNSRMVAILTCDFPPFRAKPVVISDDVNDRNIGIRAAPVQYGVTRNG